MAESEDLKSLEKRYNFLVNSNDDDQKNTAELSRQLEIWKNATPFRVVEMALEIQVERMRVAETTQARDAAVNRLLEAYTTVRSHSELIERLQKEREERGLERMEYPAATPMEHSECALRARIAELEAMVEDFRNVNQCLKEYGSFERKMLSDPPPHYEDELIWASVGVQTEVQLSGITDDARVGQGQPALCEGHPQLCKSLSAKSLDIVQLIQARNEMLASIPLPNSTLPDMTLVPITLPPQVTLHEFLNTAPASLRTDTTTNWCPEREEHGFMYAPMFKCSTNPRAVTAHRWSPVDPVGRMSKATECFYNNEGTWYYAGSYKAFLLDVVSTKEWEHLSTETTSALIKETLAGRKNTTPQNNYETGQLYAAGALKVACVGLQCVGFNLDVYTSVTELAAKFTQMKWKPVPMNTSSSMSPSTGSSASGMMSTPSIASTSFSGLSPHSSIGYHGHAHTHGLGNALMAHPPSKINSPLSPHGGSGPCTPNLPNSGMSTPGVSPIGSSHAASTYGGNGHGGLGNGSPAWNISANLKMGPGPTAPVTSMNTLGLQLANIKLSPGASSTGIMRQHQHHGRPGTLTPTPANEVHGGNAENLSPGVIGSELGSGMAHPARDGMTLAAGITKAKNIVK